MRLTEEVHPIPLAGDNAYLVCGKRNTLIDTGLPARCEGLEAAVGKILGDQGCLDAILLTHHDVDHVGNVRAMQLIYGCEAYADACDLPYVRGQKRRPGIKRLIERVAAPAAPVSIRPLEEFHDEEFAVISTPGHTPGHVVYLYGDCLFTGDLFKVEDGRLTCMKKRMNVDNAELARSARKLLDLEATWIYPGHGDCIEFTDDVREELRKVAERYEREA